MEQLYSNKLEIQLNIKKTGKQLNHVLTNQAQIFIDKFMHEARVMICEMYCTINRRVDLHMLAEKLQMSEEESEKWMVEMVRNSSAGSTTMDAKIDSSAKQVFT